MSKTIEKNVIRLRDLPEISAAEEAKQRAFQILHYEIGALAQRLPSDVSEITLSTPTEKYPYSPDSIDNYYSPPLNAIIRRTRLNYMLIEDYKADLPDDPHTSSKSHFVRLPFPIVTELEVLGSDSWIAYGNHLAGRIQELIMEASEPSTEK